MNWRQLIAEQDSLQRTTESTKSLIFLIVDDHDAVLQCLVLSINSSYPDALLLVARDYQTAVQQFDSHQPTLVILDLEIPEFFGQEPSCKTGLRLLKQVMKRQPVANILVLGNTIKPLVRVRTEIYQYSTGFTAANKNQSVQRILELIELTLQHSIYLPPDIRVDSDFKPKWLTVLTLKFQSGLSDKAIAKQMNISDRTLRNYWMAIQDALEVYDDPNKDTRIQIEHAARRAGFID